MVKNVRAAITFAGVRPYLDLGFNRLVFHAPGADQRRFLELFERDLAGPIRSLQREEARS